MTWRSEVTMIVLYCCTIPSAFIKGISWGYLIFLSGYFCLQCEDKDNSDEEIKEKMEKL
tara:strand:+ start:429 stop:605 length:177 start_codon:yes stop_codon:yes gene_type:complete